MSMPRLTKLRVVATAAILTFALTVVFAPVYGAEAPAAAASTEIKVQLAPGVFYKAFDVSSRRGTARAHMVEVDLQQPEVSVDLIYPGVVAQGIALSRMANAQGAIAGVNADFFNISTTQPGISPTHASVGPAIASGVVLKGAVPTKQRFGPGLPVGVDVTDVIGVGVDRVARLGRLTLEGIVTTPQGVYPLRGLNQYAIAQGGIGVYNSLWGSISRKRAVCGTDNRREDPCSKEMHEVTVRDGRVVAISPEPGAGSIPEGTLVLIGRDAGAEKLRQLQIGDAVEVSYKLVSSESISWVFAVGGQPIIRDGKALPGLDNVTAAIRSGAGISADGRTLYLLALDRNTAGLTYAELAAVLLSLGSHSGINLDGGGSSTLVVREPGASSVTVKNMKPTDEERPLPNGIGVFVKP